MSNYKINFVYSNNKDTINDVLLKTLKREIKFNLMVKNNKNNLSSYKKELKNEL